MLVAHILWLYTWLPCSDHCNMHMFNSIIKNSIISSYHPIHLHWCHQGWPWRIQNERNGFVLRLSSQAQDYPVKGVCVCVCVCVWVCGEREREWWLSIISQHHVTVNAWSHKSKLDQRRNKLTIATVVYTYPRVSVEVDSSSLRLGGVGSEEGSTNKKLVETVRTKIT